MRRSWAEREESGGGSRVELVISEKAEGDCFLCTHDSHGLNLAEKKKETHAHPSREQHQYQQRGSDRERDRERKGINEARSVESSTPLSFLPFDGLPSTSKFILLAF